MMGVANPRLYTFGFSNPKEQSLEGIDSITLIIESILITKEGSTFKVYDLTQEQLNKINTNNQLLLEKPSDLEIILEVQDNQAVTFVNPPRNYST